LIRCPSSIINFQICDAFVSKQFSLLTSIEHPASRAICENINLSLHFSSEPHHVGFQLLDPGLARELRSIICCRLALGRRISLTSLFPFSRSFLAPAPLAPFDCTSSGTLPRYGTTESRPALLVVGQPSIRDKACALGTLSIVSFTLSVMEVAEVSPVVSGRDDIC